MGKWRKMYKSDIKAAGNDQEKIDNAEKKMAFFHRPMFIVRVFVAKMNLFPGRHISFAFEPNTSRISVDFGGDRVFYGTDFSELDGVTPLQIFLEILARYETAADAVFKKASKLLEEEPERSKDINEYIEFGKSLFNITKGVKTELTSKSTALRKAYATFVLDRAFDLF